MFSLLIFLSILGLLAIIALIIGRKLPYLKKLPVGEPAVLTSETESLADLTERKPNFWAEFCPELVRCGRKFDWRQYRGGACRETEKLLRRLRVVSLRLERWVNSLIDKMRAGSQNSGKNQSLSPTRETENPDAYSSANSQPAKETANHGSSLLTNAYGRERALIISIAKDPKNPELYRQLADIYFALNNLTDALEAWRTVLKLDPEDEHTRRRLEEAEKPSLPL